ncbi:uncharacterized protein LOC112169642 [Rosa chinensis]|uniref:uncharacterized protein LOC112169642 n=1 Tax=Rosa chinensis TaxID=74649 RepID=UPI000D08EC61|nr:uncharacterized protein LOC112169642 [Rosa chinensis]
MDSHLNKMLSCLDLGSHNVRIIGIWGMGGIGKTTVAQVVSERVQAQFEVYSFLPNIREETGRKGAVHLQEKLLSNLLKSNVNIQTTDMGVNVIRHRLCSKRVLLVLDDVDQLEQLEMLCHRSWFGSGSRVIITSRDEHLLTVFGVDEIYKVNALSDVEALKLFSLKALKKDELVEENFLQLSKEFLKYANGLPLAIKVLGSFLHGRSLNKWSSELNNLKKNPPKKIIDVLKISFDGMKDVQKKLFLDIACFFKGEDKDRVTSILEGYGHYPDIDIDVLMERSLVTLFGRQLWMHDLIQELGYEIVRRECHEQPGKRSRLWVQEDIIRVLKNNEGTTEVEGIFLNLQQQQEVPIIVDPFSNMRTLRLLKISNVYFSGNIQFLSNQLQLLEWHACPLKSLPSNFQADKLVELKMCSSLIKQLWEGKKSWSMLKLIDLSDSQYLIKTPNFTEVPNLQTLMLQGCTRLSEVHPSIGVLKRLVLLNMKNCISVKSLASSICMESLEILILSACSSLKKFPKVEGNMKSLLKLYLDGTAIEELPSSIEYLTGLTLLDLGDCRQLLCLPSISCLTSLKSLILTGCSELDAVPENFNCVECLEELDISGTAIRISSSLVGMKNLKTLSFRGCKDQPSKPWHWLFNCWWWGTRGHAPMSLLLPTSFSGLTSLTNLNLSDCNLMDGGIPDDLASLFSLKMLNLRGNDFVHLPESLSQLSKLEYLNLSNCSKLQSLPKRLPSTILHVSAENCTSLTDFPNQLKILTSQANPGNITTINSLTSSLYEKYRTSKSEKQEGCTLPSGLTHLHVVDSSSVPGSSIRMSSCREGEWKPATEISIERQVLRKQLELFDFRSSDSKIHAVGRDQTVIPEWFNIIASRCSIGHPLIPNLKDDKQWMGVAVCAIFSVKELQYPPVSGIEFDPETSNYFYRCTVGTAEFDLEPCILYDELHRHVVTSGSTFVCSFYVPWVHFPEMLNESFLMVAFFDTNNPLMEVKKCGIRLLYEQDIDGFIETLLQLELDGGRQHLIPNFLTTGEKPEIPSNTCELNEVDKALFESGWFHLVDDNILRWEKVIPIREEGSIIMLRKNIESVLPRYLEGLNNETFQYYHFDLSGSPAWFSPQIGFTATMDLRDNLQKSKKWMGFALCASLTVKEEDYSGSCELQIGIFFLREGGISGKLFSTQKISHGLVLIYIPKAKFLEDEFSEIGSGSKICIVCKSDNPDIEVKTCGFRILYQQDLQGFVQRITHCILRSSDFDHYNKLVVEDWISLIGLQSPKVHFEKTIQEATPTGTVSSQQNAESVEELPIRRPEVKAFQFSQQLRHQDWTVFGLNSRFPGINIPKWFTNLNKGSSAEISLPPKLFDDGNWLGISVCAYVSVQQHPTNIIDISNPDSQNSRELICYLDYTNVVRVISLPFPAEAGHGMWSHPCDFSWFIYIPRVRFSSFLNECNAATATIGSNSLDLGLQECALRLVFKEDVEDLIQTLSLCHSSSRCHHCEQAAAGSHDSRDLASASMDSTARVSHVGPSNSNQ